MKWLKQKLKIFLNSFMSLDSKYLKVISADALFIISTLIFTDLLDLILRSKANVLSSLASLDLSQPTPEMVSYIGQLKSFAVMFVAVGIIYLFLVILAWSASQAYIWKTINRKKHSYSYYKKSFLMNLFLLPLFIIIFAIITVIALLIRYGFYWLLFKVTVNLIAVNIIGFIFSVALFVPIILFVINLLNLIYSNFSKTHLIGNSIASMFGQIRASFYVPHVFMAVVALVATLICKIFSFNSTLLTIASIALLILLLGWMRFYLKGLVEQK